MKSLYEPEYERVIALKERSAGNETVGDMWIDAKSFDKNTPLEDIISWSYSKSQSGRLSITIDESSIKK